MRSDLRDFANKAQTRKGVQTSRRNHHHLDQVECTQGKGILFYRSQGGFGLTGL
jgi:hypothetical protein